MDGWQQGTEECGEYVSHGDYKFEPSSDELKVTTSAKFKDSDADITIVFDENLYSGIIYSRCTLRHERNP